MVRSLSAATLTAIGSKKAILPRKFLWVKCLDSGDSEVDFYFTNHGFNITLNIINAYSGATESKNYIGDNIPFASIPPFPEMIGLDKQSVDIELNIMNSSVSDMIRGHQLRNAIWQIHQQFLDPASRKFVDTVPAKSWGFVKASRINEGSEGNPAVGILSLVKATDELDRSSRFMWSDASVRAARSGDRLLKWGDNTEDAEVFWQVGE